MRALPACRRAIGDLLLGTCFLYATVGVYSIGYFADEERAVRSDTAEEQELFARYSTRFFLGLNAFAWSMICAPLVNSLAVLWIAVEITTVVSALLVALDNTEGATEAAWKYVLIASSGLGIALLATIFMYYSGAQVLGESYDLALDPLVAAGSQLPATPVRLAFVLAVVGFGTKVGLFPVHTWLPDAHAEAPTPVSALLSGSLLAVSFYAILRYYQIATAALGSRFPQTVLMVFGVLSLLLAALYLLEQRDIKRLLAYSSVEHMGIIAIGVSFGAPIAFPGCCCMSSRTPPPRPTRSWAPVCSCASSAPRARPDDTGHRAATVVGADVLNCRSGIVSDAAIRLVSQRIPDRCRRLHAEPQHRHGRAGHPGQSGVPRPDAGDDADLVRACTGGIGHRPGAIGSR